MCLPSRNIFLVRDESSYPLPPLSAGTQPGLALCRPCACGHCLCEFIYVLVVLCLEGMISLVSSILTGSYNLSVSSSAGFSEPRGRTFIGDSSFRIECCKASHSVHCSFVRLCVVPIYWRWKLLWRWLGKTLIYAYRGMLIGAITLLQSFHRAVVSGSLQGPRPI